MGKEQRSLPETASRSSCKLGWAPELPAAGMDQERWTGCSSLGGRCAVIVKFRAGQPQISFLFLKSGSQASCLSLRPS